MSNGNPKAARLGFYVRRVEDIDAQIAELKEEKTGELRAAAEEGFHRGGILQMVKDRKKTPEERRAWAALLQGYRAALGMLDGTPLGDEARRQFFPRQQEPAEPAADQDLDDLPEVQQTKKPPAAPTPAEIEAARKEGAEAASAGKTIVDNPYPYDDGRRASWDEGWCQTADTDGMDIPEALKPKSKRKKQDDAANDQDDKKEAA